MQATLTLLFPSSGELSGVLLGVFMLGVLCVALVGFVASFSRLADSGLGHQAHVAAMMNLAAAALPFLPWLIFLITPPR